MTSEHGTNPNKILNCIMRLGKASHALQGPEYPQGETRRRTPGSQALKLALLAVALIVSATVSAAPAQATTPGVFISPFEIVTLPTTGKAWDAMRAAAVKTWGTPTIANQSSTDDTNTLAGALVAVRLNNDAMRAKVRTQLANLVASHPYDRVLGLARQLPAYIIAADLVGLYGTERASFEAFLREAALHNMEGHSGGTDLRSTALRSPNNWGTMSRAAMAAIAVYLGDTDELAFVAMTQRAWLGEAVPNQLRYTSTNWHESTAKVGISPRGASRDGNPLGGVQPEDQRRTGEYVWAAPKGSYPHEALQGAVLTSVILDRAGALPFNAGDNALIRAEAWLAGPGANPASGDDRNTPYMLNEYGGSFPTGSTTAAKNIAWCDWLYS